MDMDSPRHRTYDRPSTSDGEEWHEAEDPRHGNIDRSLLPMPQDGRPVVPPKISVKAAQMEQQRTQQEEAYESGSYAPPPPPPSGGRSAQTNGERGYPDQRGIPGAYPQDRSRHPDDRGPYTQDRDRSGKSSAHIFAKAKKWVSEAATAPAYENQEERASKYRRQREEARDRLEEAEVRIQELESARVQDRHAINHFRALYEQELKKVEGQKVAVNAMQENIDNRELFLGRQLIDSEIKLEYGRIISEINTWATGFGGGVENSSMFQEECLAEYRIIAPMCNTIKDVSRLVGDRSADKKIFVRGWVAYVMTKRFLRPLDIGMYRENDIGIDEVLSGASRQLEDAFWLAGRAAIPYRAFNDWRALSTELLSRLPSNQAVEERTERAVQVAVDEVMRLVHSWRKQSKIAKEEDGEPQSPANTLAAIFRKAIQLASMLRRQRAMWSLRFPMPQEIQPGQFAPLTFDASFMKDQKHRHEDKAPEQLRQILVAVVIAPALYKRGTIQGARYESEEAISEAVVSMKI